MAGRFIVYVVLFKARAEIRKEKQIVKEIETFRKHSEPFNGREPNDVSMCRDLGPHVNTEKNRGKVPHS